MPLILARCNLHPQNPDDDCGRCEAAVAINDRSLHPYGRCGRSCRHQSHYSVARQREHGTLGKSGILVYYADGTTSADRTNAEDE